MSACRNLIALILFICLASIMSATADAGVLVSDTFTLNTTNRRVYDSLNALYPEVGGGYGGTPTCQWKSGSMGDNPWIFAAGGVVSIDGMLNMTSRVRYAPLHGNADVMTVSVDIDFAGHTAYEGNAMVGFHADGGTTQNIQTSAPWEWTVWLRVRGSGHWELYNGTSLSPANLLASGSPVSGTGVVTMGGFHNLKLSYNKTTNPPTISVWYDSVQIVANKAMTQAPPAAGIGYAGFGACKIPAIVRADNFVLSGDAAPSVVLGDINNDGSVNVLDLQALVAAWGSTNTTTPPSINWNAAADLTANGYVNVGDLQVLVAHWGEPH